MATADEILATMSEETEKSYLVVDNDMRTIAIPDDVKILGVESDDDVHRLHFCMPKAYGEVDLSGFLLRINYLNANNEPDMYIVVDNAVVDDHIEFSWLVGRTAARFKGDVKFIVCAKEIAVDGVVEREFNTTVAKLPVLEGLETSEAVAQLHPDVIEGILLRLSKLETSGGVSDEQIANAVSAYLAENPIEAGATQAQAEQIAANTKAIEELQKSGTGGGVTQETDPTVPAWAKAEEKPAYTASEVGADPAGTAAQAIGEHNVQDDAHEDIRALIAGLTNRLNALADSDDTTLDQLSELVAYIKNNKALIDQITTGKISTSDIVDNLTTNVSTKVLSAAQGVKLKALIDAIVVPSTLPNPQPIVINGESYDGSVKKEITIQPGSSTGGAAIDDTTPSASTTYSSEKIEAELSKLNEAVGAKVGKDQLDKAVEDALTEAKNSGEFKGEPGEPGKNGTDYVLTEEDKREIAGMIEEPGGTETVDLLADLEFSELTKTVAIDLQHNYYRLEVLLYSLGGIAPVANDDGTVTTGRLTAIMDTDSYGWNERKLFGGLQTSTAQWKRYIACFEATRDLSRAVMAVGYTVPDKNLSVAMSALYSEVIATGGDFGGNYIPPAKGHTLHILPGGSDLNFNVGAKLLVKGWRA